MVGTEASKQWLPDSNKQEQQRREINELLAGPRNRKRDQRQQRERREPAALHHRAEPADLGVSRGALQRLRLRRLFLGGELTPIPFNHS